LAFGREVSQFLVANHPSKIKERWNKAKTRRAKTPKGAKARRERERERVGDE